MQHSQVPFGKLVSFQPHLCEAGKAPKQFSTPEWAGVANYAYHLDAGKLGVFMRKHCIERLGRAARVRPHDGRERARQRRHRIAADARTRRHRRRPVHRLLRHARAADRPALRHRHRLAEARAVQRSRDRPAGALHRSEVADRVPDHFHRAERGLGLGHRAADAARRGPCVFEHAHDRRSGRARAAADTSSPPAAASRTSRRCRGSPSGPGYRAEILASQLRGHRPVERLHGAAGSLLAGAGRTRGLDAQRPDCPPRARRWTSSPRATTTRSSTAGSASSTSSSCITCSRKRTDTDYWRDNLRPESIPQRLQDLLELWRHQPPSKYDLYRVEEVFPSASYQYILYGMNFMPDQRPATRRMDDVARAEGYFREAAELTRKMLAALPGHREMLDHVHDARHAPHLARHAPRARETRIGWDPAPHRTTRPWPTTHC